jgi:hypothetical protein
LAGRTARKTQVSRLFFQLRRIFKVDTQTIREKTIKRLEELFDLASGFAKGNYRFTYVDGQRERVTLVQRQKWARVAAYIAQIINTIANGIDEREMDRDMDKLEVLINEAKAKNKAKSLEKSLQESPAVEPTAAVVSVKLPQDAVEFVEELFHFTPKQYQASLLKDESKRIVVRWSRQAGKTTCIALRAIWFALTHPKTLTLIVAPTLRQSMIMSDRIQDFLGCLPKEKRSALIEKLQRTTVRFKRGGSRIVALPNSPQLLRGYTADQVIADEAGFFREDDLVFYNVLYPMLSTTDGTLIASSTPWSKDSVFYRMCQSPEFSKHVTTCEDVVKSGLIKQSFIDEMRAQLPFERFQREFMAEFVEDVDAWLTQSLIVQCIDSNLEMIDESQIFMDR